MAAGGGGGAVEGPATLGAEDTAVLAGVTCKLGALGPATPEPEDWDELVVTVVRGVISPGEGVCAALWFERN